MKTTHEYRGYVFTVTYEAKDPAYVVNFPDIPEIITSGKTLSEALDLHLESLQKLGKPVPKVNHRLVVEFTQP